jgi:hypothetical protein
VQIRLDRKFVAASSIVVDVEALWEQGREEGVVVCRSRPELGRIGASRNLGADGGRARVFWFQENRGDGSRTLLLAEGASALSPVCGGQKLKQGWRS